jgi:hypothetical protein
MDLDMGTVLVHESIEQAGSLSPGIPQVYVGSISRLTHHVRM